MKLQENTSFAFATAAIVLLGNPCSAVQVVTTLPTYAAIASYLTGEVGEVSSICRADEDAHFVKPKPSFALMLKQADLFVTTGLDLESWAPILIERSGNRRIQPGAEGYVSASSGIELRDIPASTDRSQGDVHIYGNPHIFTSPSNAKTIAANITAGLIRVDAANADLYRHNLAHFQRRIDVALFGPKLLAILDTATLEGLVRGGELIPFLETQVLDEQPLIRELGGWLGRALPLRDQKIVAYHTNWSYLTSLLGIEVVDYVEPKPGIPPSARHVHQLIERISAENIRVILAASYFSRRQIDSIAERTGCYAAVVSLGPDPIDSEGYFRLVDSWIDELLFGIEGHRKPQR